MIRLFNLWHKWKNRHRHEWKVFRVAHGTIQEPWLFAGDGPIGTQLYERCQTCGHYRTRIVEGIWYVSDFE